jgi:LPXTG-site transpeptidase (sortase) family protein
MSVAQWLKPQYLPGKFSYKNKGKLLSNTLIGVGVALLVFVGGNYFRMFQQQHSLMRQWEVQNERADGISTNDLGLTRLSIPSIHLDVVISEGTSKRSLSLGPGHLAHTAIPGDPGNAVIAAHRDTFFRHIADLKMGDDIYIQRNGRSYRYVVTGRRIVSPDDISVLESSSSERRLTLITCYPVHYIGPAPKRLIIMAKQVQSI